MRGSTSDVVLVKEFQALSSSWHWLAADCARGVPVAALSRSVHWWGAHGSPHAARGSVGPRPGPPLLIGPWLNQQKRTEQAWQPEATAAEIHGLRLAHSDHGAGRAHLQ